MTGTAIRSTARSSCGVYTSRPSVCRRYSCAGDRRICKDFDAMELNQEWIDANLGGDAPNLLEILMDAGRSVDWSG
jgi:Fe-S-cluster containining protein